MSYKASKWAVSQTTGRSAAKHVLLLLAYHANKRGLAYPSGETLAREAEMDIKTVYKSLRLLEQSGFIKDTGDRKGEMRRVKVFCLVKTPVNAAQNDVKSTQKRIDSPPNPPKNGVESTQKRVAECTRDTNVSLNPQYCVPSTHAAQQEKFTPPTLEEVKFHCVKIGLPETEAQAFIDHHEARGWFLARGVKMKKWHAALGTWKRNYDARRFATVTQSVAITRTNGSPNPVAVRIGLENDLKRTEEGITKLRQEMHYEWDRTPERRARLKELQEHKAKLEMALQSTQFGVQEVKSATLTTA